MGLALLTLNARLKLGRNVFQINLALPDQAQQVQPASGGLGFPAVKLGATGQTETALIATVSLPGQGGAIINLAKARTEAIRQKSYYRLKVPGQSYQPIKPVFIAHFTWI